MKPIKIARGQGVSVVIDSMDSVLGARAEMTSGGGIEPVKYTLEVSGFGGIKVDAETFLTAAAELAKRGAK
jgi:hypothetical protein